MHAMKIIITFQTISLLFILCLNSQSNTFLTPTLQLNAMESALNEFYKYMEPKVPDRDINLISISNNIFHRKVGFEINSLEEICKDCVINYSDTINFPKGTEFSNKLHNKSRFKLVDLPEEPDLSLTSEYIYFNPLIKNIDSDLYLIAFICYEGYNVFHTAYRLKKSKANGFDVVSVALGEFYQF